jgi:hypothetical protein
MHIHFQFVFPRLCQEPIALHVEYSHIRGIGDCVARDRGSMFVSGDSFIPSPVRYWFEVSDSLPHDKLTVFKPNNSLDGKRSIWHIFVINSFCHKFAGILCRLICLVIGTSNLRACRGSLLLGYRQHRLGKTICSQGDQAASQCSSY